MLPTPGTLSLHTIEFVLVSFATRPIVNAWRCEASVSLLRSWRDLVIRVTTTANARPWWRLCNSNPSLLILLLLIIFLNAILNKTGDNESLYLILLTTLKNGVSIANNLTLQWVPDIVITSYKLPLIIISHVWRKSTNNACTITLYCWLSAIISFNADIFSITDLPLLSPVWYFPKIWSTAFFNLLLKRFTSTLYVVLTSDDNYYVSIPILQKLFFDLLLLFVEKRQMILFCNQH